MATTTQNQPLPWVQPYIQDYLARTQDYANQPYQASPQTAIGPNQFLQTGWDATAQRVLQGSPELSAARGALTNQIGGQYLNRAAAGTGGAGEGMNQYAMQSNPYTGMNNPYLSDSISNAQGDLVKSWNLIQRPQWDKAMQSSGSFGNTGVSEYQQNAQNDLTTQLGRLGLDARMNAYNQSAGLMENQLNRQTTAGESQLARQFQGAQNQAQRQDTTSNLERQLQMQAMGMAPQFAQQDFNSLQQLLAVGAQKQGFDQAAADQNKTWWNEAQQYPLTRLDAMGKSLGIGGQMSGTQTTTPDPSKLSTGLGGALTGSQLGSLFGLTNEQGALWGGLLGLLGG